MEFEMHSADTVSKAALGRRMHQLVTTVHKHVPFYARHWQSRGQQPLRLQFPNDWQALPPLTKSQLQQAQLADRIDRRYPKERLSSERTSGSSAQPIEIYKDTFTTLRRSWRFLRALLACGYHPPQRLLSITTRRKAGLMSVLRWSYTDLTLSDDALLREYQLRRPRVVYGPLTPLLQILDAAERSKTRIHTPALVVSTAEQLSLSHAQRLATEFRARVADFYGMTEVGLVAWRAPGAHSYRIASDNLLLEFAPVAEGREVERVLITDLAFSAMPFVRYDTGDLVRRDHSRPDKPIVEFVGREVDCLVLRDGRRISPYRVTLCLEQLGSIKQYMVVQRSDLSIDAVLQVEGTQAEALRSRASAALRVLTEDQLPVRVQSQTQPLTVPTGKIRPVRSEVKANQRAL